MELFYYFPKSSCPDSIVKSLHAHVLHAKATTLYLALSTLPLCIVAAYILGTVCACIRTHKLLNMEESWIDLPHDSKNEVTPHSASIDSMPDAMPMTSSTESTGSARESSAKSGSTNDLRATYEKTEIV